MQNSVTVKVFEFHGDRLPTFEHEGEPWVAMRPIVEVLGLSWPRQMRKLQSQKGKFSCCHMRTAGSDGKTYQMLSMPVAKLPLWLATINPRKMKDVAKSRKIELYQEESAVALHDYWFKGQATHPAIKDDMAGLVTDLDPKVMQAIGGMMKSVLHRGLSEILPQMVAQELADREVGLVRGVTAHDVTNMAGVKDRKGLRGLGGFVSRRLRRFHAERGVAVKVRDLYGDVTVLVYDKLTSKEWLHDGGGKEAIKGYIDRKRGQGGLRLVK